MSRYPPNEYRGLRERSRSPPRFADRRGSSASIFPPRNADAPRGPRSQFDPVPRSSVPSNLGPAPAPRPGYSSLRDAPPLSALSGGDRGRAFRERDYDRSARAPSPRERSPPRAFKDPRDYAPRELDIPRARRSSRDGPPSAGSTFSDNAPFSGASFRGGFGRGRGRGDIEFRGGRGGRRPFDEREREVPRRERSPPPPRWGREFSRDERDLPRDSREPERRDDRRFDRREDERRPMGDWYDREREPDRGRRDQPPAPRLDHRRSDESVQSGPPPPQATPALQIDPGRLALLEQAGADVSVRRPSLSQQQARAPETRSYLNGRAENTANRYKQRDSSPPTQAPPVPAFGFSFAPAAPSAAAASGARPTPAPKAVIQTEAAAGPPHPAPPKGKENLRSINLDADDESKAPPAAPKAELMQPPPAAPKAPRAFEDDNNAGFGSRLQGVRSYEDIGSANQPLAPLETANSQPSPKPSMASHRGPSPAISLPNLSNAARPSSPAQSGGRVGELAAPTGPRASRVSPGQASISPRPAFASPRSDVAGGIAAFNAPARGQTPPPSAPLGPRNRSFSVSPKVTTSQIPTAPKANRIPPVAPRQERPAGGLGRGAERQGAGPPWAPPTAPRSLQWNQWRRPGQPQAPGATTEKVVPAKRDFAGEERERTQPAAFSKFDQQPPSLHQDRARLMSTDRNQGPLTGSGGGTHRPVSSSDKMQVDPPSRAPQHPAGEHSARQSFFGQPAPAPEDDSSMGEAAEDPSSSSEDEMDAQQEYALFKAKYDRKKRALEAKMIDLSAREYRATTPLETIARLTRVSAKHLDKFLEEQEMDADGSPMDDAATHEMPPATHSSGSDDVQDVSTPKDEDDMHVEVRSSEEESNAPVRRIRRPTPEPISLPYLSKAPRTLQDNNAFQETIQRQDESKAAVLALLIKEDADAEATEDSAEDKFDAWFQSWRETCEDEDREREEQERLERQISAEPHPELPPPMGPVINPIAEGRRLHKFNSEYEFEQVLKQSEETARLEQEKKDRERRKDQADMEKEANLPDQQVEFDLKRSVFIDANRQRDPDALTLVFSYEPQPDTFTENEQQIFIAAFKETPKKWGEIASLLPGRTYKDCIQHYYANKWDGRFRDNKTKKLKAGGRRGRGGKAVRGRGAAAMADLASAEDIAPQSVSESGRPRRAAAPTTFGEREADSKAALANPSPAKKPGPAGNGESGPEKPGKRRKGMSEKTGRKGKANVNQQQFATLAAAPAGAMESSNKQLAQPTRGMHDERMEDANLLMGMHQSGHRPVYPHMPPQQQVFYHHQHEEQPHGIMPSEETVRSSGPAQAMSSRSGASSYWSVPEQNDFAKYIAHFGTDFAAISSHMGTKTQVMIKNHYTRLVKNNDANPLAIAAREADRRRENGIDIGPPPTPTPIVKRKYDQPQQTTPRALAPHSEAMDLDGPPAVQQAPHPKHASPPQYQTVPRFTTSAQATPIQAHRVVPSPVPTVASPADHKAQAQLMQRSQPHPLGPGMVVPAEPRSESRHGIPTQSALRHSQDGMPRSQPQRPDAQFLENLAREQNKAFRMQQEQSQQELLGNPPSQRHSAHGSPADRPMHEPMEERKPLFEERGPTPPRSGFAQSPFPRPSLSTSAFPSYGNAPFTSSLLGRTPMNASPTKQNGMRSGSGPMIPPTQTTPSSAPPAPKPAPPPPAPEPPKRSNLASILNDEPDEPKPAKRDSLPGPPSRVLSPAVTGPAREPSSTAATPSSMQRRETFGQPSVPQSQFRQSSFGQSGQSPFAATPSSVKQEPATLAPPNGPPPKPDWAAQVLRQQGQGLPPNQPSPPPGHERDPRGYVSHRSSLLGGLNQPTRANPSPPPAGMMSHSRTNSLTMQGPPGSRDVRAPPTGPQHQRGPEPGLAHPLQSNPYGRPSAGSSFGQPTHSELRGHSHAHAHHNSLTGGIPTREARVIQAFEEREASRQVERDREEIEWRRDQERRAIEAERREREFAERRNFEEHQNRLDNQRRQEMMMLERERQHQQQRMYPPPGPSHPMQPMTYGGIGPGGFPGHHELQRQGDLRDQARREVEARMRHEEDRMRMSEEEAIMMRRAQEEEMSRRQTPIGFFGHPPPPPGPRGR